MAVTYQQPELLSANAYRVRWSSSLGTPGVDFDGYRVFKNGVQVGGLTTIEQLDVTLQAGEPLVVEVLDDADEEPETGFPARATLGWFPANGSIKEYKVQEFVGAAWTTRKIVKHEAATGFYRWDSRALEDVTSHQFRIVPVGTEGNDGTALSFTVLMVRHPDVPIADADLTSRFSYAAGTQKVTISAS